MADLPQPGRPYVNLSACGGRLAATINEHGASDLFVGWVDRAAMTRLTTSGSTIEPVWMPDCRTIAYASSAAGPMSIYTQPADGSTPARRLLESPRPQAPGSWSKDGTRFTYVQIETDTAADIWLLDTASGAARPLVATRATEAAPRLSPDGRWLAYESSESGQSQVYVMSVDSGARQLVSPERGSSPAWAPDGRALFYLANGGIDRVSFDVRGGEATVSAPSRVISHPDIMVFRALDEGLVVARRTAEHLPLTRLNLVLNWFTELRQIAPN